MSKRRGVIFLAWGDQFVKHLPQLLSESPGLRGYEKFLITDLDTEVPADAEIEVIRAQFRNDRHFRKSELHRYAPRGFDSLVLLDTDTRVLAEIDFGFEMAEKHRFAVAGANHYSLPFFKTFGSIMNAAGLETNEQLQYNTGVVFFAGDEGTIDVLRKWEEMVSGFGESNFRLTDQPFFSLALLAADINPFLLSRNYNLRPQGGPFIGEVKVWHSWRTVPEGINHDPSVWREFDARRGKVRDLSKNAQPLRLPKFIVRWFKG